MNDNFKYDDGNYRYSRDMVVGGFDLEADIINHDIDTTFAKAQLADRLHSNQKKLKLVNLDSYALMSAYRGLKNFRVNCCLALCTDKCYMCCPKSSRSIKMYKNGRKKLE